MQGAKRPSAIRPVPGRVEPALAVFLAPLT